MKIDIKKYNHIYMIGIGGISMSGIAEILRKWDYEVTGSNINQNESIIKINRMTFITNYNHFII